MVGPTTGLTRAAQRTAMQAAHDWLVGAGVLRESGVGALGRLRALRRGAGPAVNSVSAPTDEGRGALRALGALRGHPRMGIATRPRAMNDIGDLWREGGFYGARPFREGPGDQFIPQIGTLAVTGGVTLGLPLAAAIHHDNMRPIYGSRRRLAATEGQLEQLTPEEAATLEQMKVRAEEERRMRALMLAPEDEPR